MNEYVGFIVLLLLGLFVGGVIVVFIRTRRSDFNKCLGCPHFIHCDKGNPGNKCHLDDEK